jgi:hypothetical protein
MADTPDFDALRAERNKSMQAMHQALADEHGIPLQSLRSNFKPDACYCACTTNGPCEHKWDGEGYESEDGCMWSATCSRCGTTAFSHSMRTGP